MRVSVVSVPTQKALDRTLNEFVRLGKYQFLRQHGISGRRSVSTFIEWQGEHCDMKAVVAVALGNPQANIGNTSEVREIVERLGLVVIQR